MSSSERLGRLAVFGALAAAGLVLGGCAREAGGGQLSERFGQAVELNRARQVAYPGGDFLADMGRLFAAETQDTVTFAFNSAQLDATARSALDGQARWLFDNPSVQMTVVGHADAVGAESYNDRLGLRRAKAVVGYLARRGVDGDRLIAVESRGERELVVPTAERERRNRRAVTMVTGYARGFVGDGMDGRVAERIFRQYWSQGIKARSANSSDTGG